jgi:DNA primase
LLYHQTKIELRDSVMFERTRIRPEGQAKAGEGLHGIDFAELRRLVSIGDVLEVLGFRETERRGPQLRGPCPIHKSTNQKSRSFSVNLERNVFQCFKAGCEAKGNQLDLYAQAAGQEIYPATIELCEKLGIQPPRRKTD